MKSIRNQSIPSYSMRRSGSAMILVVVLTVLLSLVGLLFVLASRIEEASSATANVDRDISAGVDAVVDRVNKVLVDDLFSSTRQAGLCDGTTETLYKEGDPVGDVLYNEPYDFAGVQDRWLATLVTENDDPYGTPDNVRDDIVGWKHLSDTYYDIWGITPYSNLGLPFPSLTVGPNLFNPTNGLPQTVGMGNLISADADGDGVWDSVWIKLPNINSAKGDPIYTAVRIIDNCAMLNLNTAFKLETTSEGLYLSALDYERFRRGSDRDFQNAANDAKLADRIRIARMVDPAEILDTVQQYHDNVILKIENPDSIRYRLFDLSDELEIRNRFLLTSVFESRFERLDVANYTLDSGGGLYSVMTVPRTDTIDDVFTAGGKNYTRTEFDSWKIRMNPANFDDKSGASYLLSAPNLDQEAKIDFRWKYDRRHVCTFYSFDRNIRFGQDMVLDPVVKNLQSDASQLQFLNAVRSTFWPANGSVASTRDLVIANTLAARKVVVQMLYALRAYYLRYDSGGLTEAQIQADLDDPQHPKQLLQKAARKAAQTVANMIDYLDDTSTTIGPLNQQNVDPTFINDVRVHQWVVEASGNIINPATDTRFAFGLGSHIVYGYERQPFISELYCRFNTNIQRFAVELVNPYDQDISLDGWRIVVRNSETKAVSRSILLTSGDGVVPKATAPATGSPWNPDLMGRRVICNMNWGITNAILKPSLAGPPPNDFVNNDQILLQRPVPDGTGQFLTVDQTEPRHVIQLITSVPTNDHTLKRDDRAWKFACSREMLFDNGTETLGRSNGVDIAAVKGYQMPVADNNTSTVSKPLATLGDFEKVLTIGSEWISTADPNAITHFVGLASDESDVRTDIASASEVLGYVGFLNRTAGNLPGRININTAPWEVIRAAIPPRTDFVKSGDTWGGDPKLFVDELAKAIARIGDQKGAFTSIADLIKPDSNDGVVSLISKWKTDSADNVGDPSMTDDIEERDWILSRLSNIFTVRSDTFTAYIAIRIGAPRAVASPGTPSRAVVDINADRRYIAIFDRSNVDRPDEAPRLVALHRVPDAR